MTVVAIGHEAIPPTTATCVRAVGVLAGVFAAALVHKAFIPVWRIKETDEFYKFLMISFFLIIFLSLYVFAS